MEWRQVLWLVIGTALIASACTGSTDQTTTTTPLAATTTVATTTTEAGPVLTEDLLEDFEARGVVFANIEYLVTGVRISNQDTRSYAEGGEPVPLEDTTYAYLDMRATNLLSNSQIQIGEEAFRLVVDSEEIAPDSTMSFLSDILRLIAPDSAVESFLAFPVAEGTDLSGAVLVIGAPPDRVEELPLTGPVPSIRYPLTVEVSGSAEGVGPTNGGRIVYTVLDATLSEDRPHDHSTSPTGERADVGELFLVVHVRAEKVEGRGADLLADGFRLLIDGVPQAPWDTAEDPLGSVSSPAVEPGAATDAWVAFLIPEDAEDLVLQVGDIEEDPGLIPLVGLLGS